MMVFIIGCKVYVMYCTKEVCSPLLLQVDFPVHGLDLSPYIINKNHGPALYDLIAVSNHFGGMGGGHCKFTCRRNIASLTGIYQFPTSSSGFFFRHSLCKKQGRLQVVLLRRLSCHPFVRVWSCDQGGIRPFLPQAGPQRQHFHKYTGLISNSIAYKSVSVLPKRSLGFCYVHQN